MREPDVFDYEDELNLPLGDDERPGGRVQCNRCGSWDVRWRQQGGKWVLFSLQAGVEHVCPQFQAAPASDFE